MKKDEGKSRVPILPRKLQLAFASVMGVTFLGLLVFTIVNPTPVEQTVAKDDSNTTISIDGPADKLSTVENKKPVEITPEVADDMTVDGAAEDTISTPPEEESSDKEEPKVEASDKKSIEAYTYVARAGDSYTAMARTSVSLYAKTHALTLSPAQRVAAETFLTQQAGAPELDQAQQVVIQGDTVKDAVEKAQSLTDDELTAWDIFADQVDWDNDDTPEPALDDGGSSSAVDGGGVNDTGVTGGASEPGASPGGGARL